MARLLRKAKNQTLFDRDFKASGQIGKGAVGVIFKVVDEDGRVVAAAKHLDLERFANTRVHEKTLQEV